ncbi:MAG: translation initiation factor IF-3 [Firmicutes bacterium]|nr:translation initiation factor IF-3 [Bacillota bacterium]
MQVRVIDSDGSQLGVMQTRDAIRLAEDKELDLVKINATSNPPVCKIMDYGKYKFDKQKSEKEAKKNQKTTEMKEIWLSMNIGQHDIETKVKAAQKFIVNGDKVKVALRMKGRQQAHSRIGVDVMHRFFELVKEVAQKEKEPSTEGRQIIMIIAPIKK